MEILREGWVNEYYADWVEDRESMFKFVWPNEAVQKVLWVFILRMMPKRLLSLPKASLLIPIALQFCWRTVFQIGLLWCTVANLTSISRIRKAQKTTKIGTAVSGQLASKNKFISVLALEEQSCPNMCPPVDVSVKNTTTYF